MNTPPTPSGPALLPLVLRSLVVGAPALLVLTTASLLLWGAPRALRQISHDQVVLEVQQASLRLRERSDSAAPSSFLDQLNQASRDVATFVRPSVVHISAQASPVPGRSFGGMSTGSGWIWDTDGHILTNRHVVVDADRIDVQLHDGTVRPATIVGSDPSTDIAVIKIAGGQLIPSSRADASETIQQGSLVFAFGSPLDFRFSMSQGIISGLGRSVGLFRSRNSLGYENFIQVDAAINPGNSGGPLTNHRGEVIGMNTAIATNDTESEGRFTGIGLAIPLDMIESVATQLIGGGVVRKGFLGITVVDQTAPIFQWLLPLGMNPNNPGVVVSRVDGLAERAGLREGDVILGYDETRITGIKILWDAIAMDADDLSNFSIWRGLPEEDAQETLTITLTRSEALPREDLQVLDIIEDDMSSYYRDIGFNKTGVLVVRTEPDKPARRGGLLAGDIIHRVNGRDIQTVGQLRSTISSMLPDSVAKLELWRLDPELDLGRNMTLDISLAELDRQRWR